MLFNSYEFALFLPTVFVLYWFLAKNNIPRQNIILLVASYVFYGWWDFRFLFLLMFSTFLDYYTGLKIFHADSRQTKKIWLIISVSVNLGFLGFFKYYNFFIDSFSELLMMAGLEGYSWTLGIILPIGISFYTFHGLSYVFDIYYGRITPVTNVIDYSLFVSFFPLLVAGPIERATHLLPQVQRARVFSYPKAVDGLRQIMWGLFKKIVIADSCAVYANEIFDPRASHDGSTLLVGAFLFAIQIYGDFSGYSDIALGTARLFGFELLRNFAFPYFSRDIAEFWRRWHISLSSWFRDYLYFPLGGSRGGLWTKIRNTFIIFLVSGFWHGANWTFVIWGALNAFYFLPLLVSNANRNHIEIVAQGKLLPSFGDVCRILLTFSLTVLAWIFFRAESVSHALQIFSELFSASLLSTPTVLPYGLFVLIVLFFLIEWIGREQDFALRVLPDYLPVPVRWTFYYAVVVLIFLFFGKEQQFIYFQF